MEDKTKYSQCRDDEAVRQVKDTNAAKETSMHKSKNFRPKSPPCGSTSASGINHILYCIVNERYMTG